MKTSMTGGKARIEFTWRGEEAKARMEAGAKTGLRLAAEYLLGQANTLTPVRTGQLRRSGMVIPPDTIGGSALIAMVTYNTRYAVRMHEGIDYRFNQSKNPQAQAKYLETPLLRDANTLRAIIQTAIARAL